MRENKTKTKLRNKEIAVGTVTDFREPNFVEIVGYSGFDFIMIDMEHEARGLENLENMIRAAELVGITPIVRLPEIDESYALRALEIGAMGLMMPHVKTKADTVRAVRAAKYPPKGVRGMHSHTRATRFGSIPFPEHVKDSNEQTQVLVIIEDMKGVENIDEIVTTEGLDAIVLGAGDLSVELGVPLQFDHPTVIECVEKVINATNKVEGVSLAQFIVEPGMAKMWTEKGCDIIIFVHDSIYLYNLYKSSYEKVMQAISKG